LSMTSPGLPVFIIYYHFFLKTYNLIGTCNYLSLVSIFIEWHIFSWK
jgi:hypothetical protein